VPAGGAGQTLVELHSKLLAIEPAQLVDSRSGGRPSQFRVDLLQNVGPIQVAEQNLMPYCRPAHRFWIVVAALFIVTQTPAAQDFQLPNAADSTKFAVIGDAGTGERQQYEVGAQMADVSLQLRHHARG
jgi:hypothetical protein